MPSAAQRRPMSTGNSPPESQSCSEPPTNKVPQFKISPSEVEGLVLNIEENLRLSNSMQAGRCNSLKSLKAFRSRLSVRSLKPSSAPYYVRKRFTYFESESDGDCKIMQRSTGLPGYIDIEDPHELLEKLLREGSLVNEAVRRLEMDSLSENQESDEESNPGSPVRTMEM